MYSPLKISIITPSFNQGEYIEECILSVLNQDYPNLEYIIIDGGSTDSFVEKIKKQEKYLINRITNLTDVKVMSLMKT